MNKHYRSLIFTNHGLDRLVSRSITQEMVYQTITYPEKKFQDGDTTKFIKTVHDRRIHVVAHWIPKDHKWLVISVWVRGEKDTAPFIWRVISFPFWVVWRILTWLWQKI